MDALIQWLHGDPVAVFFVLVLIPGLFIGALIATARAEGR